MSDQGNAQTFRHEIDNLVICVLNRLKPMVSL